eukprot:gnl/TRDRNA2_/TRDRNA2_170602_c0_seq1.p1 gnl/TRDRNA2_/TRDRNA2_170602_c0~~gnl/TRDRNA2_/TRDRNA2_170602_c0_seq1.p1  ORF type:complete len:343 (-),score=64.45 gnl/TRDRNA2_/TRDRNA2_170602_c0_seq1:283-1287(-)
MASSLATLDVDLAQCQAIQAQAERFLTAAKGERRSDAEDAELLHSWPALAPRLPLWDYVVQQACGAKLSQRDREMGACDPYQGDAWSSSLTYGEVNFCSFMRLLHEVVMLGDVPCDGTATFVDLGCGAGKALVAAALFPQQCHVSHNHDCSGIISDQEGNKMSPASSSPLFARCVGIELLSSLATAASLAGELLSTCVVHGHDDCKADGAVTAAGIETVCGDILEVDWSMYDVVYAASTCMSPTLCDGIWEHAKRLRAGASLIMLKDSCGACSGSGAEKGLFSYKLLGPFHMSWGYTMAHIYTRLQTEPIAIDVFASGLAEAFPIVGTGLMDLD